MAATSVQQLLRRAEVLARAKDDTVVEQRELIRLLTIVLALGPFTRVFDAPDGDIGRPSEQWEQVAAAREARALSRVPTQRLPPLAPPPPGRTQWPL